MSDKDRVKKAVRAALEREPRINLHRYPVHMDFKDGVLTLEGEVENVAAKKLGTLIGIVARRDILRAYLNARGGTGVSG